MAEATQQHTLEEAKAELLAAQTAKDAKIGEEHVIPPGGRPPIDHTPEPPPPETEAASQGQMNKMPLDDEDNKVKKPFGKR